MTSSRSSESRVENRVKEVEWEMEKYNIKGNDKSTIMILTKQVPFV